MINIDSSVGEVHGYQKQGAAYEYTRELGYHPLLATRADSDEVLQCVCAAARRIRSEAPSASSTRDRESP